MRGQSYVILAIIFVILVAVFAVTNVETVKVNYLFWSGEAPLILVILFSVLMGGVITAAVGVIKIFRLQREVRTLKSKNKRIFSWLDEHGIDYEMNNESYQEQEKLGKSNNENN
ncbi:LapA family protein [Virgibacillus ndiopensis]|uniref:LapA family protein n=1 Tax=Virgibacillus ndiopensis TaxID=2004408 RepID=UPI000C06AEE7|nr:lipopolysaccharide assembly protein LapA domain-containing protein [Virgibacillus ndiopensis]